MTPFVGQIEIFGGNFAPVGWAFCNGQLLPISEYEVLYVLLGTAYGGDGIHTFGLPDLRGRSAVGFGQGPGLYNHSIGAAMGQEQVTLIQTQIPSHSHPLLVSNGDGATNNPSADVMAKCNVTIERGASPIPVNSYTSGAANVALGSSSIAPLGGGNLPHTNMQPQLALNYIIATAGIFPSQS
jgi:microcystin-dependent protein